MDDLKLPLDVLKRIERRWASRFAQAGIKSQADLFREQQRRSDTDADPPAAPRKRSTHETIPAGAERPGR